MLQALGTRAILKKLEQETQTATGIFLAQAQENPRAEILSLGQGTAEKYSALSVGDSVVVEWSQTQPVKSQGQTVYVCDVTSIYAKETQ